MKLLDFFESAKTTDIDCVKVEMIEKKYNTSLPKIAQGIISIVDEPLFIEEYRVISYSEIMNAEDDLHVAFTKMGIIPFVDCMDNAFIVYDFENKSWTRFIIVDKCKFGETGELEKIMK